MQPSVEIAISQIENRGAGSGQAMQTFDAVAQRLDGHAQSQAFEGREPRGLQHQPRPQPGRAVSKRS